MSDMPPNQDRMLKAVRKALKDHGFPGDFVLFFAEDESGRTGMGGTLGADDLLKLLADAGKEIREKYGAGETRQ